MVVKHVKHESRKAGRECTELNPLTVHASKKVWSMAADKGIVNGYI